MKYSFREKTKRKDRRSDREDSRITWFLITHAAFASRFQGDAIQPDEVESKTQPASTKRRRT